MDQFRENPPLFFPEQSTYNNFSDPIIIPDTPIGDYINKAITPQSLWGDQDEDTEPFSYRKREQSGSKDQRHFISRLLKHLLTKTEKSSNISYINNYRRGDDDYDD